LKKKLNLGVIIDSLDETDGGKYTYQINLLNKIININFVDLNISFFHFKDFTKPVGILNSKKLLKINYGLLKKTIDLMLSKIFKIFNFNYFSFLDVFFLKKKIDLVYFITPNNMALYIHNTHMINTVWDLFHLDGIEFPETGNFISYNLRHQMLKRTLPRSVAIICDSFQTINKLSEKYSVDKQRCFKLEYSVPEYITKHCTENISKIKNFDLKQDYIFYPSQLWAHKNHIYILEALKIYNSNNKAMYFLFSGSDKGNLEYIKKVAKELGIEKNILYLDFVNQNELISLYKNALALVMPTYALPTNIPPLEALYLECPIIYSKSDVNNELFFKDSLWEVDLNNPEDLSKTIAEIKNNKNDITTEKVKLGKSLLKMLDNNFEKDILNKIFNNFLSKIKTHKS
jgi:glycosyltransferase involved in cell wall biosynthesis